MGSGITVAICCYNSAQRLPETLRHILGQRTNGLLEFELIIIDNASTDNTTEVAVQALQGSGINYKVIHERNPGLSYARKRAVLEAIYELILFCDDDNWLAPDYLLTGVSFMDANPYIGMLGGQGIAVPEVSPPAWFKKYSKSYALGPQAKQTGLLPNNSQLYGAGLIVRKELLLRLYSLGFESMLSDRKGDSLTSGGDTELCLWVRKLGYSLCYHDTLKFQHFIPASRLTENYFLKRSKEKGKTEAIFLIYRAHLNNEELKWLSSIVHWYYEIFKRVIMVLIYSMRFFSFEAQVSRVLVLESIKYRWGRFTYFKGLSAVIKGSLCKLER